MILFTIGLIIGFFGGIFVFAYMVDKLKTHQSKDDLKYWRIGDRIQLNHFQLKGSKAVVYAVLESITTDRKNRISKIKVRLLEKIKSGEECLWYDIFWDSKDFTNLSALDRKAKQATRSFKETQSIFDELNDLDDDTEA